MLILKSQSLIYLGENIYWCKNHEKYTNWWERPETTNVAVNGTQGYHCSVNLKET